MFVAAVAFQNLKASPSSICHGDKARTVGYFIHSGTGRYSCGCESQVWIYDLGGHLLLPGAIDGRLMVKKSDEVQNSRTIRTQHRHWSILAAEFVQVCQSGWRCIAWFGSIELPIIFPRTGNRDVS